MQNSKTCAVKLVVLWVLEEAATRAKSGIWKAEGVIQE